VHNAIKQEGFGMKHFELTDSDFPLRKMVVEIFPHQVDIAIYDEREDGPASPYMTMTIATEDLDASGLIIVGKEGAGITDD